jgi:short-subunit dehydrogenase
MGTDGGLVSRDQIAVEGFSDCLRMELKPFGIAVVVIEPGAIRTEWGQIALDTLQQASGHTVYVTQSEEKRALVLAAAGSGSDPDVVAREIVKAIQAARPKTRYVVGAYAKPMVFMLTVLPDRFNAWFMAAISKSLLKWQRKESATETPQGI